MQRSICTELVRRLQRHSAAFTRATAFAAELDCLLALAGSARDYKLARPLLTPENVLYVKAGEHRPLAFVAAIQFPACKASSEHINPAGRHLLVEQVVESCIPNSLEMESSAARVQVCSRPYSCVPEHHQTADALCRQLLLHTACCT